MRLKLSWLLGGLGKSWQARSKAKILYTTFFYTTLGQLTILPQDIRPYRAPLSPLSALNLNHQIKKWSPQPPIATSLTPSPRRLSSSLPGGMTNLRSVQLWPGLPQRCGYPPDRPDGPCVGRHPIPGHEADTSREEMFGVDGLTLGLQYAGYHDPKAWTTPVFSEMSNAKL